MDTKDEPVLVKDAPTSRSLTDEEFAALSRDMNEVLERHGCDMSVVATISMTKRLENNGQKPEGTTEEATKTDKEA